MLIQSQKMNSLPVLDIGSYSFPQLFSLVKRVSIMHCGLIHTCCSLTLKADHRLAVCEKSC